MAGVFRFDTYVRDWFTGTRHLDLEPRAVYWDLCCLIYEYGGPVKCEVGGESEDDLRKTLGIGKVGKLRRLLGHLVAKRKIWMVDSYIGNDRAILELAKRADFMASCGGQPWGDLPSEAVQFEIIRALSLDNRPIISRLSSDNRPIEEPKSGDNKDLVFRENPSSSLSLSLSKESKSSTESLAARGPSAVVAPRPRAKMGETTAALIRAGLKG